MSDYNIMIPIPIYHFMLFVPQPTEDPSLFPAERIQDRKPVEPALGIEINLTVEDLLEAGYHNDRTPWGEEEDTKLLALAKKNDLTWNQIAEFMEHRTPKMCYSRYRRLTSQTKQPWTVSEDRLIRQQVADLGEDWASMVVLFPGRTAKQLEQHYNYCLRPEINRGEWSLVEDLELIQLMKEFGKNWKMLESRMNGRTQQQIKNRYFGRLKKLHERKAARIEGAVALTI